MNVKVSPMVVLILGLLLVVGGVSAAMKAESPAEKVGAALPGLIVVIIALVMNSRQKKSQPRDGKHTDRTGPAE